MREKLKSVLERYYKVTEMLNDPEVVSDLKLMRDTSVEYKQLTPVAEAAKKYLKMCDDFDSNKELMRDSSEEKELRELAEMENHELEGEIEKMEEELRILLIPKDPNDMKNCIVEVRAGTGGDEAGIFAGDLFRMYQRYADHNRYKIDVIDFQESERGGYKEITFSISGESVYGNLKFESGVHRVQRVPETEASGRVHTSAATVAILPEAEEIDLQIKDEDLQIDRFRAGGAGGQNVNKVETAIRITHLPTNTVVACQDERSQLKNLEKAMKVLRSRLYEVEVAKQQEAISSNRKSMVKTGDRSEKIRTYNYPQNRVTDHRLEGEAKNYSLKEIIEGNLELVIENLRIAERTSMLNQGIAEKS